MSDILLDGDIVEVDQKEPKDSKPDVPKEVGQPSAISLNVADQIVTSYFRAEGKMILGTESISNACLETLALSAPRLIMVSPSKNPHGVPTYTYSLETVEPSVIRPVLVSLVGEYVKQTDLYQNEELLKSMETLGEYVPEFQEVEPILARDHLRTHPYSFALSLPAHLRDLAIVAIASRSDEDLYVHQGNVRVLTWDGLVRMCRPTFKEMVDAAETLERTNIQEEMDAMKKVVEEYQTAWNS